MGQCHPTNFDEFTGIDKLSNNHLTGLGTTRWPRFLLLHVCECTDKWFIIWIFVLTIMLMMMHSLCAMFIITIEGISMRKLPAPVDMSSFARTLSFTHTHSMVE